jgi:DnaJ-domain-containing protein 1
VDAARSDLKRFALRVLASMALQGLRAACPIAVIEVPLGTADLAPTQIEHLLVGRSHRDDVLAVLGE